MQEGEYDSEKPQHVVRDTYTQCAVLSVHKLQNLKISTTHKHKKKKTSAHNPTVCVCVCYSLPL